MRVLITIIVLVLISPVCMADEEIQSLTGTWKSELGALYKSDGTDFVCFYIPEQHMEKYGHWQDKNRLTDIKRTANGIMASQYLRWRDGRTLKIPAMVALDGEMLVLVFSVPGIADPVRKTFIRVSE